MKKIHKLKTKTQHQDLRERLEDRFLRSQICRILQQFHSHRQLSCLSSVVSWIFEAFTFVPKRWYKLMIKCA